MHQRFEDNLFEAITNSNVELLKNILENHETTVGWNQTIDGLPVLALCMKFFDPEIVETLYPSSIHTVALPDDLFGYIVEHGTQNMVDTFAVNIIATINDKVNLNNIWGDYSDAEQTLESLQNTSAYVSTLVNHPTCNLIKQLLSENINPKYLSLLLIKAIEWGNPELLDHAINQIQQQPSKNWCDVAYNSWSVDHVQRVCNMYSTQSSARLNTFLNLVSPQCWSDPKKAIQNVMLYSTNALKGVLSNTPDNETEVFVQNAPQFALHRLSDEDVLKELTFKELETLYKCAAGCMVEKYGFLSSTPIHFEIALILEQYRRIDRSKTPDKERDRFQQLCEPLLVSIPYAFNEKRMDLELYYKSIHHTAPNQSVSVLDCLHPIDRAWAENHLLHQQINKGLAMVGKKSKI